MQLYKVMVSDWQTGKEGSIKVRARTARQAMEKAQRIVGSPTRYSRRGTLRRRGGKK